MKKSIMMIIVGAWAGVASATTFDWSWSSTVGESIVGPGGGTLQAGWIVQLVQYDGGYAATWDAGTVFDSAAVSVAPFPPNPQSFSGGLDTFGGGDFGGVDVYVRILDTTSGTPDNFVNLGAAGGAAFYSVAAGASDTLDSMTVGGAAAGDWQPVPEPGTIALAIAGLGAFVAKRRRNRK